jgi:hypothetical protein
MITRPAEGTQPEGPYTDGDVGDIGDMRGAEDGLITVYVVDLDLPDLLLLRDV